jgi:hypothetical protein
MDELFEILTLMQVGKMQQIPVVLFGREYWEQVVNWKAMARFGTISKRDVARLFFTDDVGDAFDHLTKRIESNERMAESSRDARASTPAARDAMARTSQSPTSIRRRSTLARDRSNSLGHMPAAVEVEDTEASLSESIA